MRIQVAGKRIVSVEHVTQFQAQLAVAGALLTYLLKAYWFAVRPPPLPVHLSLDGALSLVVGCLRVCYLWLPLHSRRVFYYEKCWSNNCPQEAQWPYVGSSRKKSWGCVCALFSRSQCAISTWFPQDVKGLFTILKTLDNSWSCLLDNKRFSHMSCPEKLVTLSSTLTSCHCFAMLIITVHTKYSGLCSSFSYPRLLL